MSATFCPFCKGAVSADVIRFGGNCPHCMLEIPGEEAPTDPGAEVRKRKEEEDRVRAEAERKRSRTTAIAVSLLLVVGIGGVSFAWYRKQNEQAAVLDMEEYYQVDFASLPGQQPAPADGAVAAAPQGAVAAAVKPAVGSKSAASRLQAARPDVLAADAPIVTGTTASGDGAVAATGGLKRASSGDALPADALPTAVAVGPTSTGGSSRFGGADISVSRVGMDVVLSDEAAIYEMAKRVINASSAQLQTCYNNRLKQVESLKGGWKVSFVIGKDGMTKDVGVSALNAADTELEQCMTRAVQGWRFQRVSKDQPVTKTYRFGPSGY
jgi:hypothetical protein